mmetsp:Transcript_22557/g.30886  ORF Transcript_22557/g.30886 Transcript_22557/m.30886 type:complete len:225 (+) Transcript_22557:3981-4655(+)
MTGPCSPGPRTPSPWTSSTTSISPLRTSRITGSVTVKVAPRSGPGDEASMSPSCICTIPWAIHRPSPLPPPDCSLLGLNCTPSLKSLSRWSGLSPGPRSSTATVTDPAGSRREKSRPAACSAEADGSMARSECHSVRTVTAVPGRPNLRALETRLRNTCASLAASPSTSRPPSSPPPRASPSSSSMRRPRSLAWMWKGRMESATSAQTGSSARSSCSVFISILS